MEILFMFELRDYQKIELGAKFQDVSFNYDQEDGKGIETAEVIVTYGVDVNSSLLRPCKVA